MTEKDNYATTPYTNEGATGGNTYISDSPFGNVRVYDLDAQIPPIERVQIAPNVENLPPATPEVVSETETATIDTIAPAKKPNYLLYGGIYLVVVLVAYKLFKK